MLPTCNRRKRGYRRRRAGYGSDESSFLGLFTCESSIYIVLLLLVLVLVLLLLLFCRPMYFPRTTLALPPSSNSDPGSHRGPSPTLPTTVRANIPHPKYLYCLQSSAPLTLPFAPTGPRTGRGKLFFFRKMKKRKHENAMPLTVPWPRYVTNPFSKRRLVCKRYH